MAPQQPNQPPNGRCRIVLHSPRSDGGFFNNPMIGKLLEQTQIQTTARYVHLARDSVKASASKIADSIEADVLADNERPDATYASSSALWGPAKPVLEKRGVQRTVFGRTTAIRRLWMCGFLPVRASVPWALARPRRLVENSPPNVEAEGEEQGSNLLHLKRKPVVDPRHRISCTQNSPEIPAPLQPRTHQQPLPHLHHILHDRGERAFGAVVESDHQLRAAAPHALTPTRLSPA